MDCKEVNIFESKLDSWMVSKISDIDAKVAAKLITEPAPEIDDKAKPKRRRVKASDCNQD